MFGNTFYRNYCYSADDNILVLFDKKLIQPKAKLFIVNLINRIISCKFSYGKQYRMGSFNQTKIQLPIKNEKIDFEFMESFIVELESERISKLEAYLLASGLKDYILTDEEQQVLSDFRDSKIKFMEYKLDDLFKFKAIKQAKSQREIPNDNTENGIPYIVQSMFNNMFSRTVNKKWLVNHNEAPVSGNQIVLGVTLPAISYQPREFGASQVITASADWLNEQNAIFIVVLISKLMYQFSYNCKPGLQIYKDMLIKFPTKNGKIDFEFMETFISAIQKQVIKDVVLYADKKIATSKEVVNGR